MSTISKAGVIAGALADYARDLRGPAANRAYTVGASDIGQCARKAFFVKHDGARDPGYVDTWGAVLRGQIIEQVYWVPALRARFGANLKFVGDRQRQFKRGFISATPDALLINAPRNILAPLGVPDIDGDCVLFECKSVDPRVKLDSPKPEHRYQAIVQLGVVRETTEFQPSFCVLVYIDASFWDVVTEFVVAFDSDVYANAKTRAVKVLTANAASGLPPEGWIAAARSASTAHSRRPAASNGARCRTVPATPTRNSPLKSARSPSPTRPVRPMSMPPKRVCARADTTSRSGCAPSNYAASPVMISQWFGRR